MKAKRAFTLASNAANKGMTALGRWAISDRSGFTLSFPLYFVCQRVDFMLPVFPAVAL
jgi:hypothetical protein